MSHGLGTGTVTISGLKVNSTNASGKLIASVQTTDDPFSSVTRTVVVAQYTTGSPAVVLVAPTFHSPASAEFVAGKLGAKWVRVQGPAVLSLIGAPAWLSISPHAGYLHGTPPANSAGTYKFTILASTDPHTKRVHGSDNLTAKQAFTLTVVKP